VESWQSRSIATHLEALDVIQEVRFGWQPNQIASATTP